MSGTETVHPLGRRREGDTVPGETRPDAERDREVTFPRARRAQEHRVGLRFDEVEGAEVGNDVFADAALVLEIEVLQRFSGGKAGRDDAGLTAVRLTGGDLPLETGGGEVLVAPDLCPGPGGQALDPGQQGGGLELPAQVGEIPGAAHAAPVTRS